MNSFITVAYKANGTSEILATPDVPYAKQREIFKTLKGGYTEARFGAVLWARLSSAKFQKNQKFPKLQKHQRSRK